MWEGEATEGEQHACTHNTQHTTHNTQHTTHNTQHTTHNTHALADLAKDGNTWFGPFSALVRVGRNMRGM